MSRLSFRPRPLDIQKRLPIVRSLGELDQEDGGASRSVSHSHIALDAENEEVLPTNNAKGVKEIPIPECTVVPTYDKDYLRNFQQPPSYVRGKPARHEQGDFVEYDLDDEDEDWLEQFNNERNLLSAEKFEELLFRLEVVSAKFQERSGLGIGTPGAPIPSKEQALEALKQIPGQARHAVLSAVYEYWRTKRLQKGKPILRRFQAPPAVTDTNPFNVFRPREKVNRPHTRRMQRRENDFQSYQKLQQLYKNMAIAQALVAVLQKREEKKREVAECEAEVQKLQIRLRHDPRSQDLEDSKHLRGDAEGMGQQSEASGSVFERENGYVSGADWRARTSDATDADVAEALKLRKKKRRRLVQPRAKGDYRRVPGLAAIEPLEPVMLFAQAVDTAYLQALGIKLPSSCIGEEGATDGAVSCRARFGRGGRIIFDRCASLAQVPFWTAPLPGPSQPQGKATGLGVEVNELRSGQTSTLPSAPLQTHANGG